MPLHLNPDVYPGYQTLVDTLFALNMAVAPKFYTIRVYGLGLAYLDLGDNNEAHGTIDELVIRVETLYINAVPHYPRN